MGYVAAKTERLILSTATTLITTNDPVKIAEDYAYSSTSPTARST
jgi:alkanesulfonate monooxygenase SsuD/methylene tetrahydromethanopterin reductase-like flavin-dependent oxidoreductase (luciferase family)